jgi:hypothetical protein
MYSCSAFRGKCRTSDDPKGRPVVFLVRISKIHILVPGIRIEVFLYSTEIRDRNSMRVHAMTRVSVYQIKLL